MEKLKQLTITSVEKENEQSEDSCTADSTACGTSTLESNLAISSTIKYMALL